VKGIAARLTTLACGAKYFLGNGENLSENIPSNKEFRPQLAEVT
jgi:hypothetical protein